METLPHAVLLTTGLQLSADDIDEAPAQVTLMVTAIRRTSRCPHGHVRTRRLHSRYERRLADVPWAGYQVRGHLRVRQLFCANAACRQRVFTERLPDVARPYARRTLRLIARLGVSGLALGGAAGARLTQRLGLHASRDTLLRLVRRLPLPNIPPLSAIGVDDWAHRQRQRYGTIVVDLEPRRPVALLHDREAATLTSWLREPAGMTVMARDRMKASSDAARAGAPQARQVADRFPLLQNLAEALDHVFSTHGKALQAVREALRRTPIVQPNGQTAVPVPPSAPAPQAQAQAAPRRSRRLATDERVWARSRQGWSKRAIAQQLGIGRRTVGRFLQAPTCPERKGRSDTGKSLLSPYKAHFLKPWNAGCREALQLFRDLRRRGYTGSSPTVARYAPRLRQAQGLQPRERRAGQTRPRVVASQPRPRPTRRATRLVLKRPPQLTDAATRLIAQLQAPPRDRAVAIALAQDFCALVRERQADRREHWLARAMASGVVPLRRLAPGLQADDEAVKGGLGLPWSNGPVEGHLNRLKLLKRSMFGRAKLDLLSQRFLLTA